MTELLVKDERSLTQECADIFDTYVRPGSHMVIEGYWQMGAKYIKYEAEGWIKREYGNATVKRVADGLGIHYCNLYAAIDLAGRYPTMNEVDGLLLSMQERRIDPTWNAIRGKVLPKNAGVPKDEAQHELLSEAERTASHLEKLADKITEEAANATGEEKEMLENVREALRESMTDTTHRLDMLSKPRREHSGRYVDWLKHQPEWACVITGLVEADPHHIATQGSGGPDALIVPLSRKEHSKAGQDPEWYYRNKSQLAEWFYSKHRIDARYLREIKGE